MGPGSQLVWESYHCLLLVYETYLLREVLPLLCQNILVQSHVFPCSFISEAWVGRGIPLMVPWDLLPNCPISAWPKYLPTVDQKPFFMERIPNTENEEIIQMS